MIGIGINLAIPADRLPTEQSTSLQLHVQGLPDARTLRDMIAAHIVRSLSSRLSGFVADPHAAADAAARGDLPRVLDAGTSC